MPIPLFVWVAAAVTTAIVGVVNTSVATSRIQDAKDKYKKEREKYESLIKQYQEKHKFVSCRFEDLGKTRLEAVIVLGKAVKFLEKAKLKERDLFEKFQIKPEQLIAWKKASIHAIEVLGGLATSALSGVATSAAVYGLIGTLATASTGTAISSLSGIAASNATLAWLGGGTLAAGGGGVAAGTLIFGGLMVGPALLVASFVANAKAGDIENQVEKHIAEMKIDEANKRKFISTLDTVLLRVDELNKNTIRLKLELECLLNKCDPRNEEDAYLVAKTAKALGQLLEVAILDKDGKIA